MLKVYKHTHVCIYMEREKELVVGNRTFEHVYKQTTMQLRRAQGWACCGIGGHEIEHHDLAG